MACHYTIVSSPQNQKVALVFVLSRLQLLPWHTMGLLPCPGLCCLRRTEKGLHDNESIPHPLLSAHQGRADTNVQGRVTRVGFNLFFPICSASVADMAQHKDGLLLLNPQWLQRLTKFFFNTGAAQPCQLFLDMQCAHFPLLSQQNSNLVGLSYGND